jgi:hypothetical protein
MELYNKKIIRVYGFELHKSVIFYLCNRSLIV